MLNIEPISVFNYFEKISQIPRGSGDEQRISDYLVDFAKAHNLEFIQDNALNVLIKKPATAGYENVPTVIIQGHMDMVCEKNKSTNHNFTSDPLTLIVQGDFLRANETTLGADNGIAIAYGMALLSANDVNHPPLEVLFTTNEEVGMDGARALDSQLLTGRYIINIDSEEEGIFLVGCAGGVRACLKLAAEYAEQTNFSNTFELAIRGLKGGHSGMEIDKHRANANILMGRTLSELALTNSFCLAQISGGAKDNAIPREADAIICTDSTFESLAEIIEKIEEAFVNEYKTSDSEINLTLTKSEFAGKHYTGDVTKKIVDILVLIPNGVQEMSADIALVESSCNLGVVCSNNEEITFASAIRSSVTTKKYEILNRMAHICELTGALLDIHGAYPGWEYNPNSHLRELFLSSYKQLFDKDGSLSAIHAGLECGLLLEKVPNADVIAFGPNMYDVHTPNERVSISSVLKNWKLLLKVLSEIKS